MQFNFRNSALRQRGKPRGTWIDGSLEHGLIRNTPSYSDARYIQMIRGDQKRSFNDKMLWHVVAILELPFRCPQMGHPWGHPLSTRGFEALTA